MTPAQFLVAFPEFEETRTTVVAAKLADALVDMGGPDFSVWPALAVEGQPFSLTDRAQAYKAAALLQGSAFGTATRLAPNTNASSYSEEYDRICLQVAGGFTVAGQCGGVSPSGNGQGSLVLQPGSGTVSVVNGSLSVAFSTPQTLPAGTLMVFVGAQPGAYYALAENIVASSTGALTAPYSGITTSGARWNVGAA